MTSNLSDEEGEDIQADADAQGCDGDDSDDYGFQPRRQLTMMDCADLYVKASNIEAPFAPPARHDKYLSNYLNLVSVWSAK